jgi:hypothetical protein
MNKILEIKFGSHLYGTNTENSDLDFKGIYLPTAKEIVLGKIKRTVSDGRNKELFERNNKDDVDSDFFSLDRFLALLTEGQTVALDMLFVTPENIVNITEQGSHIMYEIDTNKERLLTRNINAFVGYARQQAARYGIKGSRMDVLKRTKEMLDSMASVNMYDKLSDFPLSIEALVEECGKLISLEKTPLVEIVLLKGPKGLIDAPHLQVNGRAIPFHATVKYAREVVGKMLDNYGQRAHKAHLAGGVDWKALSHAVRVNREALELLTTGKITFPRPERELLLKIKTGQLPYEQVAEIIEQGLTDLTAAHATSKLRNEPDQEWVNEFLYKIYSGIVKNG